jgi:hypothetical protein
LPLSQRDYALSMKISRRRRRDGQEIHEQRSLLVHRLTEGNKAIYRLPLSGAPGNIYCEPCGKWFRHGLAETLVRCSCGQLYAMEFAVYEAVDDDPDGARELGCAWCDDPRNEENPAP